MRREFYRDKHGMTGSGQAWTPDLGDKSGDFGDKSKIPETAIIFSLSLLGEEILDFTRSFHLTSRPVVQGYINGGNRKEKGSFVCSVG
ncbi:hypothetical protein AVEN_105100-1 [Araneus ventricosus]|uniref:Uncharacterized protein n=1 Tax=Araneus ventricosus TaxID=182803 RepID=A0A4Y2K4P2_ARAVE|nr:hypothetical protein AVEN_105100-1 [Araneus ventricosus]